MSLRGRTNFRSSIYKIFSSATSIQSHGRHPNSILVAIYSLESSSPRKQQVTRWHFTTTQPAKPAIYIHSLPFNISVCLLWYRNWKHSSNRSRTHLYISHHSLGHVAPSSSSSQSCALNSRNTFVSFSSRVPTYSWSISTPRRRSSE